ncbi:hypothetical protein [Rhodococcoides fascians]|uniref:hypothetical protein n=1 Tax=Rhodococcoides fascians TaxID=1828 RepID=UPI00068E00DC|nr:hypothetical protein [Rhodococcus fascians]
MTMFHSVDILDLVHAAGANGLTPRNAAIAMFDTEKPARGEIEKSRRRLEKLVAAGQLVSIDGNSGGQIVKAYFLATTRAAA